MITSLDRDTAEPGETWRTFQMHDMHVGPLSHWDAPLNLYSVAVKSIIRVTGGKRGNRPYNVSGQ